MVCHKPVQNNICDVNLLFESPELNHTTDKIELNQIYNLIKTIHNLVLENNELLIKCCVLSIYNRKAINAVILNQIIDQSSSTRTIKLYQCDWSVEHSDFMKVAFWNLWSSLTVWQVQTFLRHFLKVFLENAFNTQGKNKECFDPDTEFPQNIHYSTPVQRKTDWSGQFKTGQKLCFLGKHLIVLWYSRTLLEIV